MLLTRSFAQNADSQESNENGDENHNGPLTVALRALVSTKDRGNRRTNIEITEPDNQKTNCVCWESSEKP